MYRSLLASIEIKEGQDVLSQLTQHSVKLSSRECVAFPGTAEQLFLPMPRMCWEMSGHRCVGSVVFTNFRMALLPGPRIPGTTDMPLNLEVPWGVVDLLKLLTGSAVVRTGGQNSTQDVIEVSCKDFRIIHLRSLEGSAADVHDRMMKLHSAAQHCNLSSAFVKSKGPTGGWLPSPWQNEFERQGLDFEAWRPCNVNADYEVTPSYPSVFWVPTTVSDDTVRVAAQYRSKGRLPLLTWRHRDKGSLLLRCSQPHAGASSQSADAELLEAARCAAGLEAHLMFFDLRSGAVAAANSWRDGGTERPDMYHWVAADGHEEVADILFVELDNIHAMRASWLALQALLSSSISERQWLSRLNETRWLDHCRRVTEAAQTVARCLHGSPMTGAHDSATVVVVHCSEGWDRTSQVCGLAQLLLDPYYRTAEGLCVLVEKDWILTGHKFRDRIDSQREKDRSPIFLQWLFCVAAVQAQMPQAFEYTQDDLALLVDLWLSGWTGSMVRNSERERQADPEEHVSLWGVWLSSLYSRRAGDARGRRSLDGTQSGTTFGSETPRKLSSSLEEFSEMTQTPSLSKGATFDAMTASFKGGSFLSSPGISNSISSAPGMLQTCSRHQKVQLVRPVTSLKRFELWPWALRFDDVVLAQVRAEYLVQPEVVDALWPPRTVWWLPDARAPSCGYCHRDFSLFRRRHHCRACGHIFCSASTCLTKAMIPSLGYSGKVYLCRHCLEDKEYVENSLLEGPAKASRRASSRRASVPGLMSSPSPLASPASMWKPEGGSGIAPVEVTPIPSPSRRYRRASVGVVC